LGGHQVAPAADQQAHIDADLAQGLDRPQIGAGTMKRRCRFMVSDGAGVARVGLVLAADHALAGAVDGQARDVDQREAGFGQHDGGQTGDAADHVETDADGAPWAGEHRQLVGQACERGRRVVELAVEQHGAVRIERRDPMQLLGDVDADAELHGASRGLQDRPPAGAVVALHSDGSQSLISGRGGVVVSGDLPPEPSRAASMRTIPTPPPCRDPGMPGSRRQALQKQHPNGRAA
jgi:hypothetical protein